MLRILSNSTSQPVVGANVSATNKPDFCDSVPATNQTTIYLITNGSVWYSFPTENDGGYSFVVNFSSRSYNFTAGLSPISLTCVTLYVPSGTTNITNDYQSSCDSSTSTTTTFNESCNTFLTTQNNQTGNLVLCHTESYLNSTTTSTSLACPVDYPNGVDPQDAPAIHVQENSTAYLCVRFYYYNPNSTMTVNASDVFGIAGYETINSSFSRGFNASPNFTTSASPGNLTVGGSENLNEGAYVVYAIHANTDSNGTYNYGFQAAYYPSLEDCNGLGEIVVGNGIPNYDVGFGSCTASITSSLNSEGFTNGTLYAEIVGVSNSTS